MMDWEEFLKVAKKGTQFEFYPNTEKDFCLTSDLVKQIGKVCTVEVDPYRGYEQWLVPFEDSEGQQWCFYSGNQSVRNASFRIIPQPKPKTIDELEQEAAGLIQKMKVEGQTFNF
jgi:hypothetical protein